METTPETGPRRGRSIPESVRAGARDLRDLDRDTQYDLLTAALLGVAVGAGAALLIGAGLTRRPQPSRMQRALNRGSELARRGRRRGSRMISPDAVRHQVLDYVEAAREAVADTVDTEMKDLRRAVRRQRKRLGL